MGFFFIFFKEQIMYQVSNIIKWSGIQLLLNLCLIFELQIYPYSLCFLEKICLQCDSNPCHNDS